jgi:hypothetical protein
MTSQEENVFVITDSQHVKWEGPWMRHISPMAPPTVLYFRISNCLNYRQYQLRYIEEDGSESLWEENYEPFPDDSHLREFEKEALEMHRKRLEYLKQKNE